MYKNASYAGFLSGNSTPYVEGQGSLAFKLNSSILMVGTPFSSICLTGKYGYDDKTSLSAKYGMGKIDYATVSGTRLSTDPQIGAFGIEYVFGGEKRAEYYAFITEYETVSWSINRAANTSNEIMIGMDYSAQSAGAMRTRYRIAAHNFNAGPESEEKINTSTKYSVSTEIDYSFTKNVKGSFEAGIYSGDHVGGLLALFGLGLGFNL